MLKDEEINLDPKLLFQRFVTAGSRCVNLDEAFQYEFCTYPLLFLTVKQKPDKQTNLFYQMNVGSLCLQVKVTIQLELYMFRQANKSVLPDERWKFISPGKSDNSVGALYVLDGGAFLHRILWNRGMTYGEITQQYTCMSHYKNAVIVFDGYSEGPPTKDMTHARRSAGLGVAIIVVSISMVFQGRRKGKCDK